MIKWSDFSDNGVFQRHEVAVDVDSGVLVHTINGDVRAIVPPSGRAAYAVFYPQLAGLVDATAA